MKVMNAQLPSEVGVMVLPGAVLFPREMLPLFIFEPRYQQMFELALEQSRMVVIGTPRGDNEDIHSVGGVGMIRACRRNPDGTSNLILQGLRRVRFASWKQLQPYRVALIEPLDSQNVSVDLSDQLAQLVRGIREAFSREGEEIPESVETAMAEAGDSEGLTDVLAAAFVRDPDERRQIFEELDVPTRLRKLVSSLRRGNRR